MRVVRVTGRSRGRGPAGVGQDGDGVGAEVADDLALLVHPRGERQALHQGEFIQGQLGLFSSHLDPDQLDAVAAGIGRGQLDGPDRPPVRRRLLRLVGPRPRPGLGERGYAELVLARVDPESHDLVLSGMWSAMGPWPMGWATLATVQTQFVFVKGTFTLRSGGGVPYSHDTR